MAGATPIRVAVDPYAPLVFEDTNGIVKGISIDILEDIAKKEGWELEYVPCTWSTCLEELDQNNIDLVVNMAYSQERSNKYYFSNEPIISDWGVLYTTTDKNYESILDVNGKTLAAPRDDLFYQEFRATVKNFGLNCVFIEVKDSETVLQYIDEKRVDAGIAGRLSTHVKEDEYNVIRTNVMYSPVTMHFAVIDDEDKYIIDIIDSRLNEMKNDRSSIYYTSQEKWMMKDKFDEELPSWIINFIIVLILLLLVFAGSSAILEKRVRNRTEELRKANTKLQITAHEQEKMATDLKKYAEQLEQSHEIKDIYTDVLRHDIMNPIGVIRGSLELITTIDDEKKKARYLQMIKDSNEKVIEIIESASKFAKLEDSEEIVLKKIALLPIIQRSIHTLQPNITSRNVSIEFDEDNDIMVIGNPMIQTVFLNLISNAIKYSPESSTITIGNSEKNGYWDITVADEGEGIDDQDKPFIFDRFKRVNKGPVKGTGLGLAIVKRIIELHNGEIGVYDNPKGKGSVFKVHLLKAEAIKEEL